MKRDANGDGQLTADELPLMMVVAFLRSEPPGQNGFYVPAASPPPALAAETPAWFQQADFNGDGDVSRREFLAAPAAFARLDANNDHFIDAAEAAQFEVTASPKAAPGDRGPTAPDAAPAKPADESAASAPPAAQSS